MTDRLWFLVVYGGLFAALLLATVAVWELCQPARDPDLDGADLTDIELAAINGGPRLAAITAATALRRSHVTQTLEGTLVAHGPLADGAGDLERELFETVRRTPGSPAKALVDDATQSETVQRIVAQLTEAGLRLDDTAWLRLTVLWLCACGLALAGVVGAAIVLLTDVHAWQELVPGAAVVAAALLLTRWLGKRRTGPTAAGRQVLDRARTERKDELRAAGGHLAFAVAIIGGAALWHSDPAFAAALDIPSHTATSVGNYSTGSRRAGTPPVAAADAAAADEPRGAVRGVGLGWRPELEHVVTRASAGFLEVVAESVDPRRLTEGLDRAHRSGLTVVPHGIGLSLGGADPPDRRRLRHLAAVAERLDAPLVSEHIAFVRAGGLEAGHLLPVQRTTEMLEILCENVARAQARLPVPLALEHVAALLEWPGNELDEATFVSELIERTGALLLLDLSNLYANARNHGWDARDALHRFPLERIAYVHVGGGVERDGVYHDTHADPVVAGVLALVEELFATGRTPGVLLERDSDFPPEDELLAELGAIAAAAARGTARSVTSAFDAPTRVVRVPAYAR